MTSGASPIWPGSLAPPGTTCRKTTPTACSPCRSGTSSASCPPPAPRKSPWWWAMPPRTSSSGWSSWPGLYAAAGVTREDIVQIILPPGLANWRRDLQAGAEYLGASVIPAGHPELRQRTHGDAGLQDLGPGHHAAPGPAPPDGDGPHEPGSRGVKPQAGPAGGLAAAPERCAGRSRRASRSSCATAYGITEVMGPGLAFSCGADGGLHFSEDHFYPEIIDPETGTPAPPGAPGELVITTLSTVAFPLVRFRSGDRTSLFQEPCACGRTLVRLGEITGRTDPIFSVGGIKVHPDQVGAADPGGPGRTPAQIPPPGGLGRGPGNPGHRTDGGGGVFLRRNQGAGMPVPPGPAPSRRTTWASTPASP